MSKIQNKIITIIDSIDEQAAKNVAMAFVELVGVVTVLIMMLFTGIVLVS